MNKAATHPPQPTPKSLEMKMIKSFIHNEYISFDKRLEQLQKLIKFEANGYQYV
jgi:hypothetical protein